MKTVNLSYSKGNRKLPKTTAIFNMCAALDCPAERLNLCQCAKECYAKKAERQYPACLPYRREQARQWKEFSAEQIAHALTHTATGKRNKVEQFRFSEAGDFDTQADVEKMAHVALILRADYGVQTYGYTARTDLNLIKLLAVAQVNVSNDENGWQKEGANRFLAVPKFTGKNLRCVGDCTACTLCLTRRGATVEVELH